MTLTNTELRALKRLSTAGKADRVQFLAEGVRVLEESVRHKAVARRVFVCEDRLTERGKTLVGRMQKLGGTVTAISTRQLELLSEAETAQGVAALFDVLRPTLVQLSTNRGRKILVCDGISDPGNLGTLFRSALAFGFESAIVCGDSADSYSPKTVRASAGAVFGIGIVETTAAAFLRWASDVGAGLVAADKSGQPLAALGKVLKPHQFVCLAVGSEAKGVSQSIRNGSAALISIRHEAAVESLNAAVAGSILMKGLYDLWCSEKQ
jgi:TrmH family RNA methyltransferase